MNPPNDTRTGSVSAVTDVQRVPLNRLTDTADEALRRIVPPAETTRVLVAAFNASL
jgi:hypothetical protein